MSSNAHRERLSPDEVFSILGNELRVEILRVLATVDAPDDDPIGEHGLSFSELYDRVDSANTSQFSYHLGKLTGVFVYESEDGYKLTFAGVKIVRTILAGTYNERPEFESVELDGLCPDCGATTLRARHEDEQLTIRCANCDMRLLSFLLSPGQVKNRTPEEIMHSTDQYVRDEYSMAVEGVCAECLGRMDGHVRKTETTGEDSYLHIVTCEQCGHRLSSPVELRLIYHPAVISFYWEHGIDITSEPFWKLLEHLFAHDWQTDVLSTDPYEFRVALAIDGDELVVHLDDDLSVTSVRAVETQVGDDRNT